MQNRKALVNKELSNQRGYLNEIQIKLNADSIKLSCADFLYFSIITQSSTGYGDILPNSKTVRATVSVQILVGILILVFLFSHLTTKKENNKQ